MVCYYKRLELMNGGQNSGVSGDLRKELYGHTLAIVWTGVLKG
jgi:hypothetical protein